MKIVAIIGSPRGQGAGYRIVKTIEERMKAMGEVDFRYLLLKEANLKNCLGCYTCMARGEERCPLKDQRAAMEQELLEADGVILSSPVHVANVSLLMKNFMDRFAYTNHRPVFHRQKVLTVVNMAGTSRKETQAALRWALGGSQLVHELAIQTPPWPQTDEAVAEKERAIEAAAARFYRACLDTSLPTPSFGRYLTFLMMQRLARVSREYLTKDFAFYEGKAYYYETRLPRVRSAVARALAAFADPYLKRIGPGRVPWPRMNTGPALVR